MSVVSAGGRGQAFLGGVLVCLALGLVWQASRGQVSHFFLAGSGAAVLLTGTLAFITLRRAAPRPESPPAVPGHTTEAGNSQILRHLLGAIDGAAFALNKHGKVLISNRAADAILGLGDSGFGPGGPSGSGGLYLAAPDGQSPQETNPIVRALRGEAVRGAALRVGRPTDPNSRWVSVNAVPFLDPSGQPQGAVIVMHDLTDLRKAEDALRVSEEHAGRLFRDSPLAMVTIGPDGRVLEANQAFCQMLGHAPNELCGRDPLTLTHPDDLEKEQALTRKLLAGELSDYRLEKRCLSKDGVPLWVRWSVSLIRDESGRISHALAMAETATERKQSEAAAKESQELLRRVLESIPVGVWITDPTGEVSLANPAGKKIWARSDDVTHLQKGEYQAWWVETGQPIQPSEWGAASVIASGEPSPEQALQVLRFDGQRKTLVSSTVPYRTLDGRIGGAIIVQQDVTPHGGTLPERTKLEEDLQKASAEVLALRALLPLCPLCQRPRNDPAYWQRVQAYVDEGADRLEGVACLDCSSRAYQFWKEKYQFWKEMVGRVPAQAKKPGSFTRKVPEQKRLSPTDTQTLVRASNRRDPLKSV